MTKRRTISRQASATTAISAVVGLVMTANIANAMNSHHSANEIYPTIVSHGTNGWLKSEFKNISGKQADKKLVKGCFAFAADGKRCGGGVTTTAHPTQPAGGTATSAQPAGANPGNNLTTTQTHSPGFVVSGQPTNVKTVDRGNGIASISNGVTTSAISNGKTLTVTATSPGMITVSDGTTTVTMSGGSLTLGNAPSILAAPNLDVYRNPNTGAVTFAIKPTATYGSSHDTPNGPPSSMLGEDLASAGRAAGNVTTTVLSAPTIAATAYGLVTTGAIIGTIAGHPIKDTELIAKSVADDAVSAIEWVGGIF